MEASRAHESLSAPPAVFTCTTPTDNPCTQHGHLHPETGLISRVINDQRLNQIFNGSIDIPDPHIPQANDKMNVTALSSEDDEHGHARMQCCCGRPDCAYLEHNNAALGGLERDLETAARLGQALLSRHESYINESQAERARLSSYISELESERLSLQSANEKIVAENRELLQHLEQLNSSLADSDRDVKRLEDLLLDCELEVKRLNGLVRRTEELDGRVQEMERERQILSKQMEEGQEESRSTLTRWRESERRVRELEEDVRRIEWEARLDREKHEEIVARLEKERTFERELGGAEGRLKAATALQSIDKTGAGSKNVVSHFVRDILQDNASLQAGIEELRQLLQSSNEEVQNLREQVLLHQPVDEDEHEHGSHRSVSLDREMASDLPSPKKPQREVHVHHHYHTKSGKGRVTPVRRFSRRRAVMPTYGVPTDSSVPSTPLSRPYRYPSSPVVPLNLHQSQPHKNNRWSMQSTATASTVLSSIPSSPRSYFDRGGSIFDRIEPGEESSRPTSPESVGEGFSPALGQWKTRKDKLNLHTFEEEDDHREALDVTPVRKESQNFDELKIPDTILEPGSEPKPELEPDSTMPEHDLTPKPSIMLQEPDSRTEYAATESDNMDSPPQTQLEITSNYDDSTPVPSKTRVHDSTLKPSTVLETIPEIRPSLTREGSHETLVSISGMDIHLARRPSPTNTLELMHSHFAHSPAHTRKVSTTQPLASVTEYTVVSTPSSTKDLRSNRPLRHMPSSIDVLSELALPKPKETNTNSQNGAIGRLGGWVRGKWGIAPMKSVGNLRSASSDTSSILSSSSGTSNKPASLGEVSNHTTSSTSQAATPSTPTASRSISMPDTRLKDRLHAKVDPEILFAGRSPGVNQRGFIPGFRETVMNKRTPSQIMASVIDEEGLKEGLNE